MDMKIFCQDVSVVIRSLANVFSDYAMVAALSKSDSSSSVKRIQPLSEGRVDAFGGFAPATETY